MVLRRMDNGSIRLRLAAVKAHIKGRLGPLWWYAAGMFIVQRLGDLINIYIGLWLVPHWVPNSQLGALLPLGQIGALLGLPLTILLSPFGKFLNVFAAKGQIGKVKALLQDVFVVVAVSAMVVAGYTYLACPLVFERMRVGGTGLVWILCGLALTSALIPVLSTALQSLRQFPVIGAVGLVPAPVRLAALWMLLPILGVTGYFSTQLLVAVIGIAISVWGLRHVLSSGVKRESYRLHLGEIARFTVPVLFVTVAGTLQGTCESVVIRNFLPDKDSAAYYIVSRFTEIPIGIWGAVGMVYFPLISERHERGQESGRMLRNTIAFMLLAGGATGLALSLGADWLLGLTSAWRVYRPYSWLMGLLVLRTVLWLATSCFTTHEVACRRFGFVWYSATLSLIEAGLLYGLTGIGFFQPYLPANWFQTLSSIHAGRLDFVVTVMIGTTVAYVLCIAIHGGIRAMRTRRAPV